MEFDKLARARDLLAFRADLGDKLAEDAKTALDTLKSTPPDGSRKERKLTETAILGLMTNKPTGVG